MPRPRHKIAPRDVPAEVAARRLGLTAEEFARYLDPLFGRGFPRPDPTTGLYDLVAIDAWMDARHNLDRGAVLTGARRLRDPAEVFDQRARRPLSG